TIGGRPLMIPGRHIINIIMVLVTVGLGVWFFVSPGTPGKTALLAATILTGILGIRFIMAIGGADMPVVVSMLNSYSGWAAAAAGFVLGTRLTTITDSLLR